MFSIISSMGYGLFAVTENVSVMDSGAFWLEFHLFVVVSYVFAVDCDIFSVMDFGAFWLEFHLFVVVSYVSAVDCDFFSVMYHLYMVPFDSVVRV